VCAVLVLLECAVAEKKPTKKRVAVHGNMGTPNFQIAWSHGVEVYQFRLNIKLQN